MQHEYAHHLMKAATWELERLVRESLTKDEVTAAKKKARVLYLSLAETVHRLLAARIDDAFYGLSEGFLEGYLRNIDRVTVENVNAAVKRHLQVEDIKYLVVTDREHAETLARDLRAGEVAWGKTPSDYGFEKAEPPEGEGEAFWKIPEGKLGMLRLDAVWAHYPLEIEEVRQAPVTRLFRDGGFLAEGERENEEG